MSGAPGHMSAHEAPNLFDALVGHERGDPAAAAPSLRPRLPHVFETAAGGLDAGFDVETFMDPSPAARTRGPEQPSVAPFAAPEPVREPGATETSATKWRTHGETEESASLPQETSRALLTDQPAGRLWSPAVKVEDTVRRDAIEPRPYEAPRTGEPPSPLGETKQLQNARQRDDHLPPAPRHPPVAAMRAGPLLWRNEQTIEISIGRIDVRAGPQPAPAPRPPSSPPAQHRDDPLAAYLDRRSKGARS